MTKGYLCFCASFGAFLSIVQTSKAAFTAAELASGSNETLVGYTEPIWREIFGNYDYNTDQQTGQAQGDIIGTATDPGFYTAYDTNDTVGDFSDDYIAFRVRMNARGPQNYNAIYVWVGIDADGDNDIDAYVNHTGSNQGHTISIFGPGTGANNSPSTSTMVAPNETNATYTWTDPLFTSYRAVDTNIDGGTTNNAGAPTNTDADWYVSFQIPFASLVGFLADPAEMTGAVGTPNAPITGITEDSPLRFLVASSNQAGNFNQDIGGINNTDPTYDPNLTWDQQPNSPLSDPFNSTGVVPEPSSSMMLMLGAIGLLLRRRR